MRTGITGHINLSPSSLPIIYAALVSTLRRFPEVHGMTCLAPGTDQLFARAVLATGGTFEAIVPSRHYFSYCDSLSDRRRVRGLLNRASVVSHAPFDKPGEPGYAAASGELLQRCNHLLAVWDGDPRSGPGGTAETVARARDLGIPTTIIWPAGASRR